MSQQASTLRAVLAVPLPEALCQLIESLEPRLELVRDHALLAPMRGPADWSGDPAFRRTAEQQRAFEALLDSAEALFGIPDVNPAALARTVRANPTLRWVMTTAAGGGAQVRQAQLSPADLDRVLFSTSAGVHGEALAEFALFGVLAGAKNLPRLLADQARARWPERWEMRQLSDLTVLIAGLGGIGAQCAARFAALGATVWGLSRTGRSVPGVRRTVHPDELPEAAGLVDALVLTLPGTEATEHWVDASLLASLAPGATLVNVGRGSVVDERALLAALDSGQLGFAALDVFEQEPLPSRSPLWTHPRALVSPHTAALSSNEEERIARRFAEDARRLLDGEALRSVVDTVEFY